MNRDFKGIWIPKEIWLDKELSIQEKILLAEIDSLDSGEERCFASDDYFMEFMGCSRAQLKRYLKGLKDKGYVETIFFNGRHRKLASHLNKKVYEKRASSDVSQQMAQKRASRRRKNEPHITKNIKKYIKKDNVCGDTDSKKSTSTSKTLSYCKKNYYQTLLKEEKEAHDKVMAHKPMKGKTPNSKDLCAWIKLFGFKAVLDALKVYVQDCEEAQNRGVSVRSMAAYMRAALNKKRLPKKDDYEANKLFAEKKAKEHKFVEITKRYAKIKQKELAEEVYFNLPHVSFISTFENLVNSAKFYS